MFNNLKKLISLVFATVLLTSISSTSFAIDKLHFIIGGGAGGGEWRKGAAWGRAAGGGEWRWTRSGRAREDGGRLRQRLKASSFGAAADAAAAAGTAAAGACWA